jgi:hypothetical protein
MIGVRTRSIDCVYRGRIVPDLEQTSYIVTYNLTELSAICLSSAMISTLLLFLCRTAVLFLILIAEAVPAFAAPKLHVVSFGKWTSVQWFPGAGSAGDKHIGMKVRPLLLDGNVKELTLGPAHDVTDRLFVVRRAFRVNDSLPQETSAAPHWQWQRGGWLLVDRISGHVSAINFPDFDLFYSGITWYRDYAAYCGVSDDGKKVYAVVAQIGRRKPVLKKLIDGKSIVEGEGKNEEPDSACSTPTWQRSPARVTFEPGAGKVTFVIRGHIADLVADEEEDEEATK